MEQLRERKHRERHRLPVPVATTDRERLRRQRQRGHEQPDPQRVLPQAAGEQTFLRRARRALHAVRLGGLGGERDTGQAVGDEIHPENVNRQQWERQSQKRREKQRPDLARVRAEHEAHEAANIVVNATSFVYRLHDRREVVVEQHHVRGFARHVGAAASHRNADVGALERRCVVHAVAGHRDKFATRLQRFHDPQFVFGRDTGEHAYVGHSLLEIGVGKCGNVAAGECDVVRTGNSETYRNGERGGRMVAGNHHHVNAGRLARFDGILRLGARRIDQPDQREQRQFAFCVGHGLRRCRECARGKGQHAHAIGCHGFGLL